MLLRDPIRAEGLEQERYREMRPDRIDEDAGRPVRSRPSEAR